MKTVYLISCSSKKRKHKCIAKEMYVSPRFKLSLSLAEKSNPDQIFILSAKHGLLKLDAEVEPYDTTLNGFSSHDQLLWGQKVIHELSNYANLKEDRFVVLASNNYVMPLINSLRNVELPLKSLNLFQQLKFLKER
jgi:hypothetical protein